MITSIHPQCSSLSYIAHVLATAGYTRSAVADDRVLVRAPALYSGLPNAAMNAVALGAHRLVAGVSPANVITTSLRLQNSSSILGREPGYRALAAALGLVQDAYLAANVRPWPFNEPPGGHQGPHLHPPAPLPVHGRGEGGAIIPLPLMDRSASPVDERCAAAVECTIL